MSLTAFAWLSAHFRVSQNFPKEQLWKYYYLYGLERSGRLAGVRYFGDNDWYRQGAEYLVNTEQHDQIARSDPCGSHPLVHGVG